MGAPHSRSDVGKNPLWCIPIRTSCRHCLGDSLDTWPGWQISIVVRTHDGELLTISPLQGTRRAEIPGQAYAQCLTFDGALAFAQLAREGLVKGGRYAYARWDFLARGIHLASSYDRFLCLCVRMPSKEAPTLRRGPLELCGLAGSRSYLADATRWRTCP